VATADEVLQEMSQIMAFASAPLSKRPPLRDDVRAYLIRQMDDDKNPQERYADARAAEAFGLLRSISTSTHYVELMTEQIAVSTIPKRASSTSRLDSLARRSGDGHELTHALEDHTSH